MKTALVLLLLASPVAATAADAPKRVSDDKETSNRVHIIEQAGGEFRFHNVVERNRKSYHKEPLTLRFDILPYRHDNGQISEERIKGDTEKAMREIVKLDMLKALYLSNAGEEHLIAISRMNNLLELQLTYINTDKLAPIADMAQLEAIRLHGRRVNGKFLEHVVKVKRLKSVDLSDTKITDDDVVQLQECRKLESLKLEHTQVSGEGILHLRPLPHLEFLAIGGPQIDDAAVKAVLGCTELRTLSINSPSVTAGCLSDIERMNCLRKLILRSEISGGELDSFRRKKPRLEIVSGGSGKKK
jgi:hypothetical protein